MEPYDSASLGLGQGLLNISKMHAWCTRFTGCAISWLLAKLWVNEGDCTCSQCL
jgi:hypothetical protein